ncbi:hypothetical protein [Sphingomonas faeni]|uniref:hypothetical protein n=1 Tax=Sphingomonas faeni TaxID=185950 RepID=UPI00335F3198
MLFLTLALLASPPACTDTKQQCRACPTAGSLKGCSSVGIACQPIHRVCRPAAVGPTGKADSRTVDKTPG